MGPFGMPWLAASLAAAVGVVAMACAGSEGASPAPLPVIGKDSGSCEQGNELEQRHGTDCLCCHAGEFGVAGSIDPLGSPVARIVVTDTSGTSLEMAPNPFGNFFRHARVVGPLQAAVFGPDGGVVRMAALAPSASCNACHRAGGSAAPIVGP